MVVAQELPHGKWKDDIVHHFTRMQSLWPLAPYTRNLCNKH